jgi:hypothetical protein
MQLVHVNRGYAKFKHPDEYDDQLPLHDTYNGGGKINRPSKAKLLAVAEAALKELRQRASGGTNYGFVYSDGTFSIFPTQVCYGALNCTQRICDDKPVKFFLNFVSGIGRAASKSGWKDEDVTATSTAIGSKSNQLDYIDYVANRSPFAPTFVTKDAKDIADNGFIQDAKHPIALVVSGGIAIRGGGTAISHVAAMWGLFKRHMPEDLAFCLAHYFNLSADAKSCGFKTGYTWHGLFAKTLSKEAIKRFVNHDYSLIDPEPMETRPYRYYDFTHTFKKKNEEGIDLKFDTTFRIKDMWHGTIDMPGFEIKDVETALPSILKQIGWPYED